MKNINLTALLILISNVGSAQNSVRGVVQLGYGINIFQNSLETDAERFTFNKPQTPEIGFTLYKDIDERNSLFFETSYAARKISFSYKSKEVNIPIDESTKMGQKYEVKSAGIGYRRNYATYNRSFYTDVSIRADFNKAVLDFGKGTIGSVIDSEEEINFSLHSNTNLGEKSIVPNLNIGGGIYFGPEEKFELGIRVSVPFKSLQTAPSLFETQYQYQRFSSYHQLQYLGKIYYVQLRAGYRIF